MAAYHEQVRWVAALVVAGLAAAACRTPPRVGLDPALDDTLSVALGATVPTSDRSARVTFLAKLADSRCAIGHVCVWAGDVGARIRVETDEVGGDASIHTAIEPRLMRVAGLDVTLVGVSPVPGDTTWRRPPIAQIRVTRRR